MSLTINESEFANIATQSQRLAVFDLDGTLVRGDSFVPFLISFARRRRRLWSLFLLPLWVALYGLGLISARTAKERLLRAFFNGESLSSIAHHARWFCDTWVRNHLQPEVLERLHWHQEARDKVILLSASPDLYVPVIGQYLGIDETICTEVANADGVCNGSIVGANCKGTEKIEALKRYLKCAEPPANSSAYADSRSDLPLLEWVSNGYLLSRDGLKPTGKHQHL